MKLLSVIPARSGSKSIKDKNIKILNGHPLIYYSIKYSLNCKLISKTIVSTDSIYYGEIAKKFGADVPFIRPKKLSGDDIQDFPVISHALIESEKYYNCKFDYVVLLRPTSPLRSPGLIEKGISLLRSIPNSDSLRAVKKSKEHPYRQWITTKNKFIKGFQKNIDEPYNLPRQKLPKLYFQTGDIEIIKRNTIISGTISGKNIIPIFIKNEDIVDIDTISDWENAEIILKKYDSRYS